MHHTSSMIRRAFRRPTPSRWRPTRAPTATPTCVHEWRRCLKVMRATRRRGGDCRTGGQAQAESNRARCARDGAPHQCPQLVGVGLETAVGADIPSASVLSWSRQCCASHRPRVPQDDPSFIVLTETKFSFRCIPVWDWYSPHRTRVEKKSTCDNALTMTSLVHW